jgi:2,4-dienoyl-CoA reductase-like NADH-dependent reductase (Old Yellow Enzyme family)
MEDLFRHLFRSIRRGGLEIKNRMATAPMGIGELANIDGSLAPRAIDYYIERI